MFHRKLAGRMAARSAIFDYIEIFYNPVRLHSRIGYIRPIQFESQQDNKLKPITL